MLNQTRYFTTARKELNSILDFITDALASSGLDPKACGRTRFRSEDLTVMLMDHASEGSRLKVTIRKTLGPLRYGWSAEVLNSTIRKP